MISCSEATRQLWEYLDATVDAAAREATPSVPSDGHVLPRDGPADYPLGSHAARERPDQEPGRPDDSTR